MEVSLSMYGLYLNYIYILICFYVVISFFW